MKYFKDITTIEELKKTYRKLANTYHPDNKETGNLEKMQEINAEYENLFKKLQASDKKSNKNEKAGDFIQIINELMKYKDLQIDIIGSWVWLEGKTYEIKDELKKLGFLWSKSRKKWYWNGLEEKARVRYRQKPYYLLKLEYGCETIKTGKEEEKLFLT